MMKSCGEVFFGLISLGIAAVSLVVIVFGIGMAGAALIITILPILAVVVGIYLVLVAL
jgi:hypothetical protein